MKYDVTLIFAGRGNGVRFELPNNEVVTIWLPQDDEGLDGYAAMFESAANLIYRIESERPKPEPEASRQTTIEYVDMPSQYPVKP